MIRLSNFFYSIMKATILSLIIFFCFLPLFLSKNKVFILTGYIQTEKPLELTINTMEDSVYSASFFQKFEHSDRFNLILKTNKLEQLKLSLKADATTQIKIDNVTVIGAKNLPLKFNVSTITGSEVYKISDDGCHISLSATTKNVTIEFQKFPVQKSKRVYQLLPMVVVCFLPFLFCFLPLRYRELIGKWGIFIFPLLLLGLVKYFAFQHPYTLFYNELTFYNLFQLEKYDFPIFAMIYGFMAAILYFKNRWVQRFFAVFLYVLLGILLIDGIILHNLNARFIFSEISNYHSEYAVAFFMFLAYCGTLQGRLLLLSFFVLTYILRKHSQFRKVEYYSAALGIAVVLMMISCLVKTEFLRAEIFYNVFAANQGLNQKQPYTPTFIRNLKNVFEVQQNCIPGRNKRKNVIIIVAESLSTFSSYNLSHLNNYMPKLDKLMNKYAVWSNYYSNSYSTTTGIFSLLSGLPAMHGYVGLSRMNNSVLYDNSLPQKLKKNGYYTSFWTAVETDETLTTTIELAHFDKISNYKDSYYHDKPKVIFNAPADEYLFANILNQVKNADNAQPYLMVVSTISGHGPYIDPRSKEQSFAKVTNYVDEEIAKFTKELFNIGFFENGMLLITGDHRAMLPVALDEGKKLSPLAEGRVPLVIIDKELRGKKIGIYSHNDIAPSLEYYLTKQGCFNQFQNNLFVENPEENCILYQKLSPRDKVELLCTHHQATICLHGDDTSYCNNTANQKYVDFVNWLRIIQEEVK